MRKIAVLMVVFASPACGEIVDERYRNWSEAKQAGAMERGWLPRFVPSTAINIRSVHDLDTNAQRLTFELPPEAVQPMIDSIVPMSDLPSHAIKKAITKTGWKQRRNVEVKAYLMCDHSSSGLIIAQRETGHVGYFSPAEWAREWCSRNH